MRAGELKHKVTVLRNASDGTTKPNWQPFITAERNGQIVHDVYAAVKTVSNARRTYFAAAASQAENDLTVTIRYTQQTKNIRPNMRLTVDGDTIPYVIKSDPTDVYDNRQWLELHVRRLTQNER